MREERARAQEQENESIPKWINDLILYYSHTDHPSKAMMTKVEFLWNRFKDEDDAVMLDAVLSYFEVGQYFPTIAEIKPHVDAAREVARGVPIDTSQQQRARLSTGETLIMPLVTDDVIFDTLRQQQSIKHTPEQIEAGIEKARQQLATDYADRLQEIHAAYDRTPPAHRAAVPARVNGRGVR